MARKPTALPAPTSTIFKTADEVERAISKLQRRVNEVENLEVQTSFSAKDGKIGIVESNIQSTIRDVFGEGSPEFNEHKYIEIWQGPLFLEMSDQERLHSVVCGQPVVANVLKGLIARLQEKKEDLEGGAKPRPSSYFQKLNLHHRISDVTEDLFLDGYHWNAVFAGSKALINYVKERSGSDKDGTKLMYEVFSRTSPILSFNTLADQTDGDEQEGIMHLFVGAALAIRNPGGHAFPEGSEQRAIEYISFLSMLAYLVQEAKRRKPTT